MNKYKKYTPSKVGKYKRYYITTKSKYNVRQELIDFTLLSAMVCFEVILAFTTISIIKWLL